MRDDSDFARHADYIHFNPVKHGHTERVQDWPHSSLHRFVRLRLYPEDWAGSPEDRQAVDSASDDGFRAADPILRRKPLTKPRD